MGSFMNKNLLSNLKIYNLKNNVSLDCDVGSITIEDTYRKIGYFKVYGQYKCGSAGSSDAHHIRGMMAYAQERFYHQYWILDLSELDYEWGDEMDLILGINEFEGIEHVATVLGKNCIAAIATLSGLDKKPEDLLAEEGNFENLDEAHKYLLTKITL